MGIRSIAILSLFLGVIVRAAVPISLQQLTPPALVTLNPNLTGSLLQMLRPAPYRERLPSSTTVDSSLVAIPSTFRESSMTIYSAESTSMTLSRVDPTNFRRVLPSTLSERPKLSKDLILQPSHSVLAPDNQPKALSVIPEMSATTPYHPAPSTTEHAVSALVHTSVPRIGKECASVVLAAMNYDMQDIFDALDALVQAISRQTQIILAQATTFIEQSVMQLEKGVESFETTLHARHERARNRAREIRDRGTKWLYDTSEVITTGAQFSKGMAWEVAESLAHRAQRARGKAKEMAAEIQDVLNEYDGVEALGGGAWITHTKHWDEWVKRIRKQGKKGKLCKLSKRRFKSSILC